MYADKFSAHTVAKIKKIILVLAVVVAAGSAVNFAYGQEAGGTAVKTVVQAKSEGGNGLLFIAAAICVGFSSLAAGWAVSTVGAAAMGAISEKPELAGRALIFVGLAEGIAIYGLIVAIMILGKA